MGKDPSCVCYHVPSGPLLACRLSFYISHSSQLFIFFTSQWERLNDPEIWKDAATQMFYTLGMGFGTLITFASYMPKNNQCVRDTYTVVLINCGTSIFSGIVVFTILGYRELKTGIKAADVSNCEASVDNQRDEYSLIYTCVHRP